VLTETLSGAASELVERAREKLDADRLADLVFEMTAIPSPSGQEEDLAAYVVGHLREAGVDAEVQPIDGQSANAVGRLGRAERDHPRLMLYAPLDTAFAGEAAEDEPWLGRQPRADFALPPRRDGRKVIGLGAENPKAFAAAAIGAVEALVAAGADFGGEVLLGLVAGSMPIIDRPEAGIREAGQGIGVRYLLENGGRPDFAIVLKPGYAVSNEEVGIAWFRLFTRGTVNYTGIRHKGLYRNPIILAGRLVAALEEWFPEYARENGDGIVSPQASVNAIRAGSPNRLAFIPERCEVDVDMRVPPHLTPTEVAGELRTYLDRVQAHDPDLDVEMVGLAAMPGTRTDPRSWVVRSLIDAWEWRERKDHAPARNTSGASDAALLRASGVPTARIGLPPPQTGTIYDGFSMGVADADSIAGLAEVLIRVVVDTCSRTRTEVGLH
jgi:acetylornithine deacetylase/succinyl-diaminopimelate desuccinylase-like protein